MSHFAKDLVVTFGVVVMLGATLFFVKERQESNRLDRLRRSATPSEQVAALQASLPLVYKRLKIGMTKAEVAKILPRPQNEDNELVWMWVDPIRNALTSEDYARWENLKLCGDGYFIVFRDGKLDSQICAVSADDPSTFIR